MHFSPHQFDLIHTFHEIQIKYLSTHSINWPSYKLQASHQNVYFISIYNFCVRIFWFCYGEHLTPSSWPPTHHYNRTPYHMLWLQSYAPDDGQMFVRNMLSWSWRSINTVICLSSWSWFYYIAYIEDARSNTNQRQTHCNYTQCDA
jgi:hypothetical protein